MTIHQAIDRVLGKNLATAIVNDQGLHWAALAAMTACKVSHGPEVKKAIIDYFAEEVKKEISNYFADPKRSDAE